MNKGLSKKAIVNKTLQVGGATLLSRFFGIAREFLTVSYLGVGTLSDAFITAYRVPNLLRKIFAEGALSATFIPSLVSTVHHHGQHAADRLMTIGFIVFEGIVLMVCALTMWKAEAVIHLIAPGFSPEQLCTAVPILRLLMPFIFFISSGALLAGALQASGRFLVPAFSPVLMNIVLILGLILCITFKLPIEYWCVTILLAGFAHFVFHLIAYCRINFSFRSVNFATLQTFWSTLLRFIPCSISMGIMEISGFIDGRFSSYLAIGTVSLVNYANRFLGIPVGVFGVAFSTILLPHFARITTYAPKRMNFYLFEASKLVIWVMLPTTLFMFFLSEKFFHTIFVPTGKFTPLQAVEAGSILSAYLVGLLSISLNKILLNVYYALHSAWIPGWVAVITTIVNYIANYVLIGSYGATGLAIATSISVIMQSILLLGILQVTFNVHLYWKRFSEFLMRYVIQLTIILMPTYFAYRFLSSWLAQQPDYLATFFLFKIGFWLWVLPLCLIALLLIFITRTVFGIRLYFID
jgi:putative peptidoglycan lipid II flippase